MSNIPNSAMPHAGPSENAKEEEQGAASALSRGMDAISETAKQYPKTAIAAGAAVVVGAVAAAALPLVRGRKSEEGSSGKSGGSKSRGKSGAKSGGSSNE